MCYNSDFKFERHTLMIILQRPMRAGVLGDLGIEGSKQLGGYILNTLRFFTFIGLGINTVLMYRYYGL
jgi:hypothetical protein